MNLFLKRLDEYDINSPSTSTKNKVDNIEPLIFKIARETSKGSEEYGISLVGKGENLTRHINEFNSIGIPENKLIVVERDEQIYKSLKERKNEMGYKIILEKGDFIDILNNKLKEGFIFKIVDFDGTDSLKKEHFNLFSIYEKNSHKINLLRMTGGSRSPQIMRDPTLSSILRSNNTRKNVYFLKNNMNVVRALKENLEEIRSRLGSPVANEIKKNIETDTTKNSTFPVNSKGLAPADMLFGSHIESKNYSVLLGHYKGASTMLNILVSKKNLDKYVGSGLEKPSSFFNKFPVKNIVIGDKKIKVLDTPSSFKRKSNEGSSYYLIEGGLYHKKFGFLLDYDKFRKESKGYKENKKFSGRKLKNNEYNRGDREEIYHRIELAIKQLEFDKEYMEKKLKSETAPGIISHLKNKALPKIEKDLEILRKDDLLIRPLNHILMSYDYNDWETLPMEKDQIKEFKRIRRKYLQNSKVFKTPDGKEKIEINESKSLEDLLTPSID